MTLWEKRFETSMSDVMKKLNNSLPIDIRLFPYDLKVNLAWAEELKEVGVFSEKELGNVSKAIEKLSKFQDAIKELPNDEDVHTLVERRLTELLGDTGKKIHTGRSRNDQVVTDTLLFLKDASVVIKKSLKELIGELVKKSEESLDFIMPGYTHMQKAQPILLSHYLLSFAFSMANDLKRLESYEENNLKKSPLGSGAIAGTTLKIDRDRLAVRLGFEEATANSLQSTSDRAFVIELASHLAIISMHLSRYAEDFIIFNSREFNFLNLADSVTTGSSMMPQKKNPDSLELIRGITGTIYGNLIGLLTITKGVPLSYAKDLQDDKKFIFDSIDHILMALTLFSEVVNTAHFRKEKMEQSITKAMLATDLADILVEKGMPFREAYGEVASVVRIAKKIDKDIDELTTKDLVDIETSITVENIATLSAKDSIEKRSAKGGTSLKCVKEAITTLKVLVEKS